MSACAWFKRGSGWFSGNRHCAPQTCVRGMSEGLAADVEEHLATRGSHTLQALLGAVGMGLHETETSHGIRAET